MEWAWEVMGEEWVHLSSSYYFHCWLKLYLLPQTERLGSFQPKSQALGTELSFGLRYCHGFTPSTNQAPQHHHKGNPGGFREAKGAAVRMSIEVTFSLMNVFMTLKLSMLLNPHLSSQEKASTWQTSVQSSEGEIGSQNQAHRSYCQWWSVPFLRAATCVCFTLWTLSSV